MKIWTITLLLLLGSCTLNADQEASLNNALTSYINSRNNGAVISYVSFTHPKVVGYYKNQGDSLFQAHFDVSNEYTRPFFQDGVITKTKRKEHHIHIKYMFKKIEQDVYDIKAVDVMLIALSEDDGKSWFFVEESDYTNDNIFSKNERLINKE